jgi:hypothetical protein
MSIANINTGAAGVPYLNIRAKWSLSQIIRNNPRVPLPMVVNILNNSRARSSQLSSSLSVRRHEARQQDAHRRRGIPYEPKRILVRNLVNERPPRFLARTERSRAQLSQELERCNVRGAQIDGKVVHLTHLNLIGPNVRAANHGLTCACADRDIDQ